MAQKVAIHPGAKKELIKIPSREQVAMAAAIDKLRALGTKLGFPHSSAVRTSEGIRELRPRQGRSPWRAFYRQIGDVLVIGAIGPEASVDPKGFTRAVAAATRRLSEIEEDR